MQKKFLIEGTVETSANMTEDDFIDTFCELIESEQFKGKSLKWSFNGNIKEMREDKEKAKELVFDFMKDKV